MADAALLGFLTDTLLGKAVSLAADEISLSWGVNKELKKLAEKLELIQALLCDAQSKQLASKAFELWLKKLKSIALDARIALDDYGYEVLRQKIHFRKRDKVLSFFSSSNPLYFGSSMGHKIRDVLTSLDEVYDESNKIGLHPVEFIRSLPDLNKVSRLTDPFVEESEIVGRDDDALEVIRMLTNPDCEKDLPVITILGMGGQGKTTLAQVVYKDEKVGSYFDKKVWVCVSDDFNVGRLLAQLLESLTQTTCQLSSREGLVNELKEQLGGKKYLLVLDDVWNESRDEWDVMRRCLLEIGGSKGSKVIATTRNEEVASAMRTSRYHRLQMLSKDQSLALFERCAFAEGGAIKTPELAAIGERILKRCGGVPLAIKAVGGLLYSKDSESEWSMIERSDLWSTEGSGVLSAIKLSYDYLSPSLKQCFAYCATFPKDTVLKKDKLVQLWMAHGYLNPPKDSQLLMEDLGNHYLNVLLRSSLLQDAKKQGEKEVFCKMHDLVHDLALQVSKICHVDTREAKVGTDIIDAFHLSVKHKILFQIKEHDEKRLQRSFKNNVSSKLRSLNLDGRFQLDDWFQDFRCLTSLTIHHLELKKLPKAIGKITHLRFLDISHTMISKLPKSLVELYYLETLRCYYLYSLPVGFENLINLRHFHSNSKNFLILKDIFLIPRLSQMTSIQTIPFFKVDESKSCQIEQMEHLDNLSGKLRIFDLQNVSGREYASRCKLSNKPRIHTLKLHWEKREHDCDDTEVMEGLKPLPHVKTLKIDGYKSPNFPSWIILLSHLTKVTLLNLDKCEHLPSFGDMPCLEVLKIGSLRNLKCIGKEFYGCSDLDWARKCSSTNGPEVVLFPALKYLGIYYMDSLEEWSDAFIQTHSKAFPSLERLELYRLPNLNVFPNLGSLQCLRNLNMSDCPNLSLPPNWNDLMPHNSRGIPYLLSLHALKIFHCDKLVAPFCDLNVFPALKTLVISGNASFWPKDLHHLINLETLDLMGVDSSVAIDSFPLPYSFSTASSFLEDIQYPVSLTDLRLFGWSKLTSLPDQTQHLTTLRKLHICSFDGLETLPEWLRNLQCLEVLVISHCKNLKHFPSAEALKCLSNLECLHVRKCPVLKERCAKESGPEWYKIAHIPKVMFEIKFKAQGEIKLNECKV